MARYNVLQKGNESNLHLPVMGEYMTTYGNGNMYGPSVYPSASQQIQVDRHLPLSGLCQSKPRIRLNPIQQELVQLQQQPRVNQKQQRQYLNNQQYRQQELQRYALQRRQQQQQLQQKQQQRHHQQRQQMLQQQHQPQQLQQPEQAQQQQVNPTWQKLRTEHYLHAGGLPRNNSTVLSTDLYGQIYNGAPLLKSEPYWPGYNMMAPPILTTF